MFIFIQKRVDTSRFIGYNNTEEFDYKDALETTIKSKVALISIGDIRLNNELENYFTLTGSKNKGWKAKREERKIYNIY